MAEVERDGENVVIDDSRVDPEPVVKPDETLVVEQEETPKPKAAKENPIDIMKAYFEAHPECRIEDVRPVMDVLVPTTDNSEDRIKVFNGAVGDHDMSKHVKAVEKTL